MQISDTKMLLNISFLSAASQSIFGANAARLPFGRNAGGGSPLTQIPKLGNRARARRRARFAGLLPPKEGMILLQLF